MPPPRKASLAKACPDTAKCKKLSRNMNSTVQKNCAGGKEGRGVLMAIQTFEV